MTDCPNAPARGWWIFKHRDHELLTTMTLPSSTHSVCIYCGGGRVEQFLSPHLPKDEFVSPEENLAVHEEAGYRFDWDKGRITKIAAPNGDSALIEYDAGGHASVREGPKEGPQK